MNLGFVSERFESAGAGPGTISSGEGDPGGKSYGTYQLSKDTLYSYVQQAPFKFRGMLFSKEFDCEWKGIAEDFPFEFELDQHLFITKKLYLPNSIYAKTLGYNTESRKIQEAIFSIAVQHGKAKQIIKNAYVKSTYVDVQIVALYRERLSYVLGLGGLSDSLKEVLRNRYMNEQAVVLSIEEFENVLC